MTGANGFVGKALCERLLREDFTVVRALRERPSMGMAGAIDVVVGDLAQPVHWDDALKGVHAVIHLAAHVHQPRMSSSGQSPFFAVNAVASEHLARCATAAGVRKLVYASTVKVHGETTPIDRPFTEAHEPAPEDDYGRSKWEAEQRLAEVAVTGRLSLSILRPPLIYGPGVGANFQALIRLAATGWPLPLASIRNLRSLLFVGNMVDAILACLRDETVGPSTFLLSDQEDVSTPDLLRRIRSALEQPPRLFPLPRAVLDLGGRWLGRGDQVHRLTQSLRVDSQRISASLGWRPPVGLQEGLALTCAWHRTVQGRDSGAPGASR